MKKKQSKQTKSSTSKSAVRKTVVGGTKGIQALSAVSMSVSDAWMTVDIAETTVTLQRGINYRLPLDFSQSPVGAGQFDSVLYLTTLASSNFPEAVIQEDSNYKTEQRCAWTIYVPENGYPTTVEVKLSGQMRGTGWTGGPEVNGLWGTPELIY